MNLSTALCSTGCRSTSPRASSARAMWAGLMLFGLCTGACSSGPYMASLRMQGSDRLNPTVDGKPSSVSVRIFALKDKDVFANATEDVLLADQPSLPPGTWLPPHKEAEVYVGQTNDIEFEIKPEVRFVGVIGLFNETTGPSRQVLDVASIEDQLLRFDAYTLNIVDREQAAREAAAAESKQDAKPGEGKQTP